MFKQYYDFSLQLLENAKPILQENYDSLVASARENINDALIWKQSKTKELVTKGELIAEQAMRDLVKLTYPTHDIAGEEFGYQIGASDYLWAFDPIDGTAAMVESAVNIASNTIPNVAIQPYFGTSIALLYQKKAILGLIYDLINENIWIGGTEIAPIFNGQSIILSPEKKLCDAIICSTAPQVMFNTPRQQKSFHSICSKAKAVYTNRNCIGFMQLLTGEVDAVWEGDLAFHDVAALIPILEQSGIKITDEYGDEIVFSSKNYHSEYRIIAAQPILHAEIIANVNVNFEYLPDTTNKNNEYYTQKF